MHQIEDIDNPAGSAVAIGEGVDGFELIMDNGQFDQGINVVIGMNEIFQVFKFFPDNAFTFRR